MNLGMLSSCAKVRDSVPNMSTMRAEGGRGVFVRADLMEGMACRIVTERRVETVAEVGRREEMFGDGIWMMV